MMAFSYLTPKYMMMAFYPFYHTLKYSMMAFYPILNP